MNPIEATRPSAYHPGSTRRKVAILSITQEEGGGAETTLEHLLLGWPAPEELLVLSPSGSRITRLTEKNGLPHLELSCKRDRLVDNLRAIQHAAPAVRGCGLVHAWTGRAFELGWWLGLRLGIPVCGTLHDHPLATFHHPQRQKLMHFLADRLDGLACVSQAVRAACLQAHYRAPLTVIHNGLASQEVYRLPADAIRIGFLGMHTPIKGLSILEQWIANCHPGGVRWFLYGKIADELQARAQYLADQYPGQVLLRGRQKTAEIFSEIDILVHASLEFDSLPTVLIEAGMAGIPAIASNLGGAPEIIVDGETGFLFDPQKPEEGLASLIRLIEDSALRARLGTAARTRVIQDFNLEQMVGRYETFWQAHLEQKI